MMINASLKKQLLDLVEENQILSKIGTWVKMIKEDNSTINQDLIWYH